MTDVTLPYDFANGEAADASQVMANFNAILGALNSLTIENLASSLLQSLVRPGMIFMTGRQTPDDGFLFCQGQLLLRADYPDLFAAIQTTWDTTVDGDHFRLPNYQDLIPMGAHSGGTVTAGAKAGEATTTLNEAHLPRFWVAAELTYNAQVVSRAVQVAHDQEVSGQSSNAITPTPFNNIPPVLGTNFEIKT